MRALLLLLLAVPARAAFEDVGAGARGPGLGNAFVAIADDVYAVHYNPAGLGLLTRPELGASYTRLLNGLTDNSDVGSLFLGYAHPLPGERGTLATSWEQLSLDSSLYYEQAFSLAYGRALGLEFGPGRLFAGGTGRVLRRGFGSTPEAGNALNGLAATGQADPVLSGRSSVNALDADLGLLYQLEHHYSFGMSLRHLNRPNVAFSSADTDRLPVQLSLGMNYASLLSNLAFQYQTTQAPAGTIDHLLALAAERWLPRLFIGDFGVRGALTVGTRDQRQLSTGLSYRSGRMTVDYAFLMWLSGLRPLDSGTHRVSVSFRFGSAQAPDESVGLILDAMRKLKGGELPELSALGPGLTAAKKAQLDELTAQAKSLEGQARYRDAADKLQQALAISPRDTNLLKRFTRLNWVAAQVKSLPDYKTDAVESAWHKGILAYLAEDDAGALQWVADAMALRPEDSSLESFTASLERATEMTRPKIAAASAKKQKIEQLLALSRAALEDGRYDEVLALSRQALAESDALVEAWENLGTAFFALGDYTASLDAWHRAYALEKSPARRAALEGYLASLKNLSARRREAAERQAKVAPPSAPELSPQEIERLYNTGIEEYAAGRLEPARKAFEKALKADPNYVPAHKALRRVMEELSQEKR